MKKIFACRRSSLALIAIVCLTGLGIYHGEVGAIATAISATVGSVAVSNSWEKRSANGK